MKSPIIVIAHASFGRVRDATLTNVPSFVALDGVTIHVDEPGIPVGDVRAPIAFGGSFFALVAHCKMEIGQSAVFERDDTDVYPEGFLV